MGLIIVIISELDAGNNVAVKNLSFIKVLTARLWCQSD